MVHDDQDRFEAADVFAIAHEMSSASYPGRFFVDQLMVFLRLYTAFLG